MGFNFPNAPVTGDASNGYVWDGEKWVNGALGTLIYVSDSAPAAPVGALWWESDTGILFFKYNDGNSTQWVAISDGGAGAVRFDTPQVLTATQQAQARQNVYAAPFDALAYSGMQVNGSIEVGQELAPGYVALTNASKYMADGWIVQSYGPQTMNASRITGAFPPGYSSALHMAVVTANPSPGATTDVAFFLQNIEGYRVLRLAWGTANAQPITIGFWTYFDVPGTYSGSVRNGANNRSCPFSFTHSVASVWEYKVVTIPGDTAGTWTKDNTTGLAVSFTMMAGTSLLGPANIWASANYIGVTGSKNGVATTAGSFIITGVVVLPGIEAPSAARSPLITRPYDQELLTCQRYWQPAYLLIEATMASAGQQVAAGVNFSTAMRVNPTLTAATPDASANISSFSLNAAGGTIGMGFSGGGLSTAAGRAIYYGTIKADARL